MRHIEVCMRLRSLLCVILGSVKPMKHFDFGFDFHVYFRFVCKCVDVCELFEKEVCTKTSRGRLGAYLGCV